MKFQRMLLLVISVFFIQNLPAQVKDTSNVEYDYKLQESSINEIIHDTTYTALISIDTSEIRKFKKLTVYNSDNKKEFSVKASEIATDSRFVLDQGKYILDTGEWTDAIQIEVKGTHLDDSEVILTNNKRNEKVNHIVVHKEKPRPLKRVTDLEVPEEELNQ